MTLRGLDTSKPFVVVTGDVPDQETLSLLTLESAEFEAVLGTDVLFAEQVPVGSAHWVVEIDPQAEDVHLVWDPTVQRLTSHIRESDEYVKSVNLLHSLAHSVSTTVHDDVCETNAAAFERIRTEIANIYPSFGVRGLDWQGISERYADIVLLSPDAFVEGAQRWVAELGDAHTALHRTSGPRHHPPYGATMTSDGAALTRLPSSSAAARAGVGDGWIVEVEAPNYWLETTGATQRQLRQVAARRFLAMPSGSRDFAARSPTGERVAWTEEAVPVPDVEIDQENDCVRINGFVDDTPGRVDEALGALRDRKHITVDLRGNCGGSLVAAVELRRRFLRERTPIGAIRFSDGRGSLAEPVTVNDAPAANAWEGAVTFLTDCMTYSAAEDLLWGLQGLGHVRIAGSTTGGGSGRPHTRRITETLAQCQHRTHLRPWGPLHRVPWHPP